MELIIQPALGLMGLSTVIAFRGQCRKALQSKVDSGLVGLTPAIARSSTRP
jgi:hypothetical protein